MRCPKCRCELSDDARFCPKCGTKLEGGIPKYEASPPLSGNQGGGNPKGSHTGLIIGLILLTLAVLGGGGFIGYKLFLSPASSKTDNSVWAKKKSDKGEERDEEKERGKEDDRDEDSDQPEDEEETRQEETTADVTTAAATTAQETTAVIMTTGETTAVIPTTSAWEAFPPAENTYILPDSSSRYLTEIDIAWMDLVQLRLARNEIYARHGRRFKDQELQDYFDRQVWYTGSIAPESFRDDEMLNDIEKKNLDVIKAREAKLN